MSDEENLELARKIFLRALSNIAQSLNDDYVQTNAKSRVEYGMAPKIVRKLHGETCAWCSKLAGVYKYGEEPHEVYQRHDNCDCTVDYVDGKKVVDVHSKKKLNIEEIEERNAIKTYGKMERITEEQIDILRKYGSEENIYADGNREDILIWNSSKGLTHKSEQDLIAEMFDNAKYWEDLLRMQSDEAMEELWFKLLDVAEDSELRALNLWSGPTYAIINSYMRYGKAIDDISKEAALNIKNLLDRLTIDREMIVRRGTGTKHMFEKIVGDWKNNPKVLVGQSFKDDGFVSTSPFENGGLRGDEDNEAELFIKLPVGIHGAYIEKESHMEKEKELLLQKGYSYEIIHAEYRSNMYSDIGKTLKIWCEVILDG